MYIFADKLEIQNTPAGDFYIIFLRGLTHKLNNLLAVFSGFSSLLLMNDSMDDSARESLNHMKSAASNASGLSERILAAGGCARMTPQRMQLNEYLPMLERSLREPFTRHNVPFEIRMDPALPPVNIDSGRLKEILAELLKNAAEAVRDSGQPGEASMEIYAPGRSPEGTANAIDIFVHNTGAIRDDKLHEVFNPFVSTKDGSHYGIGLTVAAMLATQMNMNLGFKNDAGRVTFWLSVPVAA